MNCSTRSRKRPRAIPTCLPNARQEFGTVLEGTVQVATERSFLVPYPLRIADENQHIFAVAATLAAFGQSAREAIGQSATIGDADTADLFTEISRGVDHQLWLVKSHVSAEMTKAAGFTPRDRTIPRVRG